MLRALRADEEAVRDAGGYGANDVGAPVMRRAFDATNGTPDGSKSTQGWPRLGAESRYPPRTAGSALAIMHNEYVDATNKSFASVCRFRRPAWSSP